LEFESTRKERGKMGGEAGLTRVSGEEDGKLLVVLFSRVALSRKQNAQAHFLHCFPIHNRRITRKAVGLDQPGKEKVKSMRNEREESSPPDG